MPLNPCRLPPFPSPPPLAGGCASPARSPPRGPFIVLNLPIHKMPFSFAFATTYSALSLIPHRQSHPVTTLGAACTSLGLSQFTSFHPTPHCLTETAWRRLLLHPLPYCHISSITSLNHCKLEGSNILCPTILCSFTETIQCVDAT